jgi:hypothetical protein
MKVKTVHNQEMYLNQPWQHETAKTGVNVQRKIVTDSQLGYIRYRVDNTVTILRSRGE